jgi:hypothetical protein
MKRVSVVVALFADRTQLRAKFVAREKAAGILRL